jgi:UDP-N-acetylglucosamine 4-epimerase
MNQVYNVAVGGRTSVNTLLNLIKKFGGSDLKPEYRNSRTGDVRDSLADISKISSFLGYQPSVKLEDGLKETFEWFKSNQEFIDRD